MHAGDLLFLGARRLAAQQGTEFAVGKRLRDRPQTAGILRVPEVRDVIFASGVTEKESGHRGHIEALPVHLRRSRDRHSRPASERVCGGTITGYFTAGGSDQPAFRKRNRKKTSI